MLPSESVDAGGHTSSPKDRDENEAMSRGSQARKTTEIGRSTEEHLSLPKMVPE